MQNEALKMLVDAWNLLGKLRLQMARDLVDPILRCSLVRICYNIPIASNIFLLTCTL